MQSIAQVKLLRDGVGARFVAVDVDAKFGSLELEGQKGGRAIRGSTLTRQGAH